MTEMKAWGASKTDDYRLAGIPLDGAFHGAYIGSSYRSYLDGIMKEAYDGVTGNEEGRKDLTCYILYRGKNLIDNAAEEERLALETRAIAKLKDYVADERSGMTTAGTVAAVTAGGLAAASVAAFLWLNPALGGVLAGLAAVSAIVAGTMFYQASALGSVIRDLNGLLAGKQKVDGEANGEFDRAYREWTEKKAAMDEEWKKLNLMYYGRDTKPEMITGPDGEARLPEVSYEMFASGIGQMMADDAERGISLKEALALYDEETYARIKAGESGTVSGAVKAFNIYFESAKREKETALENEAKDLSNNKVMILRFV